MLTFLSFCGGFLVWLILLGRTVHEATSAPPPPTFSDLYYTRRPRHHAFLAKVRRRREGWLCGLRLRLRMRSRAMALSAVSKRYFQRLTCSPVGSPPSVPLANFTSSAHWSLSSKYATDDPQLPRQPRALLQAAGGDYPIVIDTGASLSVTPNISDFVDGLVNGNLPDLRGLNHTTMVAGAGLVEWTVFDIHNRVQTIRTWAFYVPDANIRLFSPSLTFRNRAAATCIVLNKILPFGWRVVT